MCIRDSYTDEPVAGDKYEEFWVPKDGKSKMQE